MSMRWKPRVVRIDSVSGDSVWQFGIETWVTSYEKHWPWSSSDDGSDRYVLIHLGRVAIEWRWAVTA